MQFWFARSGEVSIREQLVTQVVLGILSDDLAPGQRLPRTRDLARRSSHRKIGRLGSFRLPGNLFLLRPHQIKGLFQQYYHSDNPGPGESNLVIYCVYSAP
jgi:hypothetical protein